MHVSFTTRNLKPWQYAIRKRRLKCVFEGRKEQLQQANNGNIPYPHLPASHQYGRAVTKYVRARNAWRAIRGF